MNTASTIARSANLAPMAQAENRDAEEWISPIGQSILESIEEDELRDPEYKAERERNRHLREFAKLVLIRRTELGLNRQALAERMGTTQSVITRLESGRHSFSIATLQRVARALDVKLVFGFEVDDSDGDSEPSRSLVVVP
jgi:ribosome-binding protein aMBF1 (putative translation factor)